MVGIVIVGDDDETLLVDFHTTVGDVGEDVLGEGERLGGFHDEETMNDFALVVYYFRQHSVITWWSRARKVKKGVDFFTNYGLLEFHS